jgi:hypothetical protein
VSPRAGLDVVGKRKISAFPGTEFGLYSNSGHGGEETLGTPMLNNLLIITYAI